MHYPFGPSIALSACEGGTNATEEWQVFRIDGHTLGHVALETGVSVGGLESVNDLRGDFIRDGAGLLVPENPKVDVQFRER
ncbi:MAG: hypothetical protein JNM17_36970 [Archangium sp.]|nr:hypothetical protein [Archangium sp.]